MVKNRSLSEAVLRMLLTRKQLLVLCVTRLMCGVRSELRKIAEFNSFLAALDAAGADLRPAMFPFDM